MLTVLEEEDSKSLDAVVFFDFFPLQVWKEVFEGQEVDLRRVKQYEMDGVLTDGVFEEATTMFPPKGARRVIESSKKSIKKRKETDRSDREVRANQLEDAWTHSKRKFETKGLPDVDSPNPSPEPARGSRGRKRGAEATHQGAQTGRNGGPSQTGLGPEGIPRREHGVRRRGSAQRRGRPTPSSQVRRQGKGANFTLRRQGKGRFSRNAAGEKLAVRRRRVAQDTHRLREGGGPLGVERGALELEDRCGHG